MIRVPCPHCGLRNASEYRYGGEVNARPSPQATLSDAAWADYLYMRRNVQGLQTEWWYHRDGCGAWFLAERHTKTNEIVRTYLWEPAQTTSDEQQLTSDE